jgi:hypothetical protein
MSRRAAAILLAVLAVAVAALLLLSRGDLSGLRRRAPRPFLRVTPASAPPVSPAPGTTPVPAVETVRVTLYFPDAESPAPSGGGTFPPATGALFLQRFAELQGPHAGGLHERHPAKMQPHNAFLLHERGNRPRGRLGLTRSDEELAIVAALVDTTPERRGGPPCEILINGEPAETLGATWT